MTHPTEGKRSSVTGGRVLGVLLPRNAGQGWRLREETEQLRVQEGPSTHEPLDLTRLAGQLLIGLTECLFPPLKNTQVVHPDTRAALARHREKALCGNIVYFPPGPETTLQGFKLKRARPKACQTPAVLGPKCTPLVPLPAQKCTWGHSVLGKKDTGVCAWWGHEAYILAEI